MSTRSPVAPPGPLSTMRKNDDTVFTPGASPISQMAGRSTSEVGRVEPPTKQSARPSRTRVAAWNIGSRAWRSRSAAPRRSPRAALSAASARPISSGAAESMIATPDSVTSARRAVALRTSGTPISATSASRSRASRSAARTTRSSSPSVSTSRRGRSAACRRSRSISTVMAALPSGCAGGGLRPPARRAAAVRAGARPPRAAPAPSRGRRDAPPPAPAWSSGTSNGDSAS